MNEEIFSSINISSLNSTSLGNSSILPEFNTTSNSTVHEEKKKKQKVASLDEILQQSKERTRRSYINPILVDVPSFDPVKIHEGEDVLISLGGKLISSLKVFDLIIFMPTSARFSSGEHAKYLISVLEEYEKQLKELENRKSILIIIFNFMAKRNHKMFKQATKKFKHVVEFVFFKPPFRFRDPYSDIIGNDYNTPDNVYPSKMERQYTCDMLFMTKFISDNLKFKYLLYTEDNSFPCSGMLSTTFQLLERIERYHEQKHFEFEKGFCALRISSGLGGFIITKHFAQQFIEYAKNNIDFERVDSLIQFISSKKGEGYKTCLEEGLTLYASSYSSLSHIGNDTNFEEFGEICKEDLGDNIWHLGRENMQGPKICMDNDIKPCLELIESQKIEPPKIEPPKQAQESTEPFKENLPTVSEPVVAGRVAYPDSIETNQHQKNAQ